jgi:hypothetical protein
MGCCARKSSWSGNHKQTNKPLGLDTPTVPILESPSQMTAFASLSARVRGESSDFISTFQSSSCKVHDAVLQSPLPCNLVQLQTTKLTHLGIVHGKNRLSSLLCNFNYIFTRDVLRDRNVQRHACCKVSESAPSFNEITHTLTRSRGVIYSSSKDK